MPLDTLSDAQSNYLMTVAQVGATVILAWVLMVRERTAQSPKHRVQIQRAASASVWSVFLSFITLFFNSVLSLPHWVIITAIYLTSIAAGLCLGLLFSTVAWGVGDMRVKHDDAQRDDTSTTNDTPTQHDDAPHMRHALSDDDTTGGQAASEAPTSE